MCNAFLCNLARLPLPTVENPSALVRTIPHYGSLSWYWVYQSSTKTGAERVKGLLIYLQQVLLGMEQSKLAEHAITFRRIQFLSQSPPSSLERIVAALLRAYGNQPLASVVFSNQGIEVQQQATALVDFANEDLHVGAVWPCATQEEVLFSAFPECFAGILFCETMQDAEAIQIVGVRKFCKCRGFQETFCVDGPEDESSSAAKTIIAMDAVAQPDTLAEQCSGWVRDRDILKAVCGFDGLEESGTVVATGNWGCGAFGGNPHAKFIHQLLAASLTHVS
jgi:poly(ADP-ribose) glycohydrolase